MDRPDLVRQAEHVGGLVKIEMAFSEHVSSLEFLLRSSLLILMDGSAIQSVPPVAFHEARHFTVQRA